MFMKPPPAIAAFDQDICVPKAAQGMDLDYEGELVSANAMGSSQTDGLSWLWS